MGDSVGVLKGLVLAVVGERGRGGCRGIGEDGEQILEVGKRVEGEAGGG